MTSDILRIARTESLFRDVNERIAETAERFDAEDAEFVCECADPGCGERVEAPLAEYEHVRADGTRFLIIPGHEVPDYERVLERKDGYQVVAKSKDRRLARAAKQLDPRSDTEPPDDSDRASAAR